MRLVVHVLSTTNRGTRTALSIVRQLVAGLEADVVVVVPLIVPSPAPIDRPPVDPAVAGERYRKLARQMGVAASVRLSVCRRRGDAIREFPRGSIVVIGGRRRSWWPTGAERDARQLEEMGHEVVFAR